MATNSNNNGGNGQRPAGSGRKPSGSAQRPTGQRPAGSGQRPAGSGQRTGAANGQKRMSAKQRAAKKRKKVIIFGIEIVVILFMVALLYLVMTHTNNEGPKVTVLETEELQIPEEVQQDETMKGYMNIALFGVDATKESLLYKGSRSDSIMIASINMDTGDIKLVSVYRDTYLNLSNDTYNKCNAAYAKGGPMQAINMLNMNLDMNITDFVTVGFSGLTETIDALGGVYIDVKEEEISHLNNYQISIVGTTKDGKTYTAAEGSYTPVTQAGYQKLNGLQATAYCRIRYVGNDFERTARQRRVLKAVADEAKKASPAQLEKIANSVFDKVYTSLDISEIVSLLGNISKYNIVDEGGFPNSDMLTTGSIGKKGSCVVPRSLESNVTWLHEFLFDEKDYEPSSAVKEYSAKIAADTNGYVKKALSLIVK